MDKSVKEGWFNIPPIDRERYGERAGLEGPFQTKVGKVVYYDPKEGAYYDPDSDIYLSYEEWAALNESTKYGIVYTTAAGKTVPMLHKSYDTKDAAVEVAEAAVRTGSYKNYNIIEEKGKLPAHLAKFVDDKGDFTPEVKARLGKDGEERLLDKKKVDEAEEKRCGKCGKNTIVTTKKGWHCSSCNEQPTKGKKMDESYQDEINGAMLLNGRVSEAKDPLSDIRKGRYFSGPVVKAETDNIISTIDAAKAAIPGLKANGDIMKATALRNESQKLRQALINGTGTNQHIARIHELLGEQVNEAGMPASIIKHKSALAALSDKDLATKLGSKSEAELRQMAWRHGHGEGSDHYVKRVAKGRRPDEKVDETRNKKGVTFGTKSSPKKCTACSGSGRYDTTGSPKCTQCNGSGRSQVEEAKATYNKDAVNKEIKKDKRIGGKEAKAIHGLLKGRTAEKKTVKEDIALDAMGMEQDHEVQMARGQLYHAARDAIRLHQMLKTISEDNGIEAWVQSKITTAAEYLKTVADYMEYELINDGIDSTVGISADQVQMPIGETTSGGIAGVVMPLGTIQKRKRPVKK